MRNEKSSSCPWLLQCVFNKVDIKPTTLSRLYFKRRNAGESLEQLVINKLIMDAHSCKEARYVLPMTLIEKLFIAALLQSRDIAVLELIKAWKYQSISLSSILSNHYPIGNNLFRNKCILNRNLADNNWNDVLWALLTALNSNAPVTLQHLDMTGLPMTFICDDERNQSNLNLLTKSDILKQLRQKGIRVSIDICIERWSSWEKVKDVLTLPPSTICIHQFEESFSLKDFPVIEASKVRRLNISNYVKFTDTFLGMLTQFNNITELSLNILQGELPFEKLCDFLNKQTNLERFSLEVLRIGELARLVKNVTQIANLTYFKVISRNLNQQDIESLGSLTYLTHLSLQSEGIIEDYHIIRPRLESILRKLPELKYLEIYFQEIHITTNFIVSISRQCLKLIAFRVEQLSEEEYFEIFDWKDVMHTGLKWFIVSFSTDEDDEFSVGQRGESTAEYRVCTRYDGFGTGTGKLTVMAENYTPPLKFSSSTFM